MRNSIPSVYCFSFDKISKKFNIYISICIKTFIWNHCFTIISDIYILLGFIGDEWESFALNYDFIGSDWYMTYQNIHLQNFLFEWNISNDIGVQMYLKGKINDIPVHDYTISEEISTTMNIEMI